MSFSMNKESFEFKPIGYVRSVFKETFGTPRQSGLVSAATATLQLSSETDFSLAVQRLEGFSHLWVVFVFHRNLQKEWTPLVMPPRVAKPSRVGVFASRSPHRPNPIGMSLGKIEKLDTQKKSGIEIELSGTDLLDGTPVLDIKPYLSYADSVPAASNGWASEPIKRYLVKYSSEAEKQLEEICSSSHPNFRELLTQVVELDPRPTTQKRRAPMEGEKVDGKIFSFRILGFHIRCELHSEAFLVTDISLI